jgi:SAM-dependent methyltransferase
MTSIADSDAVHDTRRILTQHQSALTLINGKLQNPAVTEFQWLDLACGKGQIISQLSENISDINRRKLSYLGYDINVDHTRTAERMADSFGLNSYEFIHGDLSNFSNLIEKNKRFEFITCTNTAHEIQRGAFASIIIDSLVHLSSNGELYIYDMESLTSPELGALPWRSAEIGNLLNTAFEILGTDFRVHPSVWSHSSCKGWTVTVQREYIGKTDQQIIELKGKISEKIDTEICLALESRFSECNKILESYCRYGTETADDAAAKLSALYEFWALHRAMEARA